MVTSRFYRQNMGGRFASLIYRYRDSDMWIAYEQDSHVDKEDIVTFTDKKCRSLWETFETYFRKDPGFEHALVPYHVADDAPVEIRRLSGLSLKTNVGPMAGIAGLFAQELGRAIKKEFGLQEILVENGGDDYIDVRKDIRIGLFAGEHPLSNKIQLIIEPGLCPLGLCASSGKFGHSKSFGTADLVSVACRDTALADQFATAFANDIKGKEDVASVIERAQSIPQIVHISIFKDQAFAIGGCLKVS